MKEKIEEIIRELQFTKYIVPTDRIRSWEDLQERPIKQLEPNWDLAVKELSTLIHAEINDMLDRLRLEKQEYEPDYPIPNTDTVEGYNSAVDDLNNKIEREKK